MCNVKLFAGRDTSAVENYLTAGAVRLAQAAPSKSPQLVPLVAPVSLPGGGLAAEVDCYVNVDPNASRLVYAHVAIPPSSPQAVEHLRSQEDLCMDERVERRLVVRSSRSWLLQANARFGRSPRG